MPINNLPDRLSPDPQEAARQLDDFGKSDVGIQLQKSLRAINTKLADEKARFRIDKRVQEVFKGVMDIVQLHPAASGVTGSQEFKSIFQVSGLPKKESERQQAMSWITFSRSIQSLAVTGSDKAKIADAIIALSFHTDPLSKAFRQLFAGIDPFGPPPKKVPDLGFGRLDKIIRDGALRKFVLCIARAGMAFRDERAWAESANTDLTRSIISMTPKEGCAGTDITIVCSGQIPQSDLTQAILVMLPSFSEGYIAINSADSSKIKGWNYDAQLHRTTIVVTAPVGIGAGCIGFASLPPPPPASPFEDCGGELAEILGPLRGFGIKTPRDFQPTFPPPPCLDDAAGLAINYFAGGPPKILSFTVSNGGIVSSGGSIQLMLQVSNAKNISITPAAPNPHPVNGAFLPTANLTTTTSPDGFIQSVQIDPIVIVNHGVNGIHHDWEAAYVVRATNACNIAAPDSVTARVSIHMREVRPYLIGLGKEDVTDYAIDLPMQGMSQIGQRTTQVEAPLWARSFVIKDKGTNAVTALVVADIWSCTIAVKREVIKRLGSPFTDANVWIAGSHTHSGPAGYSEHFLYNASGGGFDEHNFINIVEGIVTSIKRAYENLSHGRIFVNSGDVPDDCGRNRSIGAYKNNDRAKRDSYRQEGTTFEEQTINATDKEMLVLKFRLKDPATQLDADRGMLCWYAIHTTSRCEKNTRVCGDNKGWASTRFEDDQRALVPGFVAAFANSNAGDVSGNMKYNPGGDKYQQRSDDAAAFAIDNPHMTDTGQMQVDAALGIFNAAKEEVVGRIDTRHQFIDMTLPTRTGLPAAIGISMFAGSTEDSTGVPFIMEGLTNKTNLLTLETWAGMPVGLLATPFVNALVNSTFQINYIANGFAGGAAVSGIPAILSSAAAVEVLILAVKGLPLGLLAMGRALVDVIAISGFLSNTGAVGVPDVAFVSASDTLGHYPKPIAVMIGRASARGVPYPMVPSVLPLQLIKIGQFGLTGLPIEITTMAGRLLRESVQSSLGISRVALGTYANGYAGYVTTPEEYDVQHYEGASTLYGRTSLDVLTKAFTDLAADLLGGPAVQDDAKPFDFINNPVPVIRNPRVTVRNRTTSNIRLRLYAPNEIAFRFAFADVILAGDSERAFVIPAALLLNREIQILVGDSNPLSIIASADPSKNNSLVTLTLSGSNGSIVAHASEYRRK